MKVYLDTFDAEKSQIFLNYFIAQLKVKNNSTFLGSGSAHFNVNGQYETLIYDFIPIDKAGGLAIDWKIIQNLDGTIPYIEVVSKSGHTTEQCSNYVNYFINEVLKLAFTKKRNLFLTALIIVLLMLLI
jgi:hypothetical protein